MTVTLLIIIFTVAISIAAFYNADLFNKLKHYPYVENRQKEYHRWLTSGFIHADWLHLGLNMFVFWSFGTVVEQIYQGVFGEQVGQLLFLLMYLSAIVFADLPTFRKYKDNSHYAAVGASGAVSAVTFVYILFFPWEKIYLYAALPIPAILFAVLYLWYEQWASKNAQDGIGHDAHFAGAVYGILFTVLLRPSVYNDFINQIIYKSPYW